MRAGNYEGGRASFVPCNEPARLVVPCLAFVPDSYGGGGMPSVTGNRHDQVAKEAPAWFKASIEALALKDSGQNVLARMVGSAGKYRFWSVPEAVRSLDEWEAATAKYLAACMDLHAAKAAEKAEKDAAWAASFVSAQAELASVRGWVVVDTRPGRALAPAGHVTIAMAEDGQVFEISSEVKGMGRGYTHRAVEVQADAGIASTRLVQ
jgi:hypothetical protein